MAEIDNNDTQLDNDDEDIEEIEEGASDEEDAEIEDSVAIQEMGGEVAGVDVPAGSQIPRVK